MKPIHLPLSTSSASVCPECLRSLPAVLTRIGEDTYLEKRCPDHGWYKTVVWRGRPALESWRRTKTPSPVESPYPGHGRGCPWDCGLCAAHRQHSCTVLVEVTQRCSLHCPICFADSGDGVQEDPPLTALNQRLSRAFAQSGPVPVQLSGGEPTMREDLPEVIALVRKIGFPHVQLNTNGLRLAREPGYAAMLREAGVSWVFLQFDGTSDAIFMSLRGRALLADKLAALEACARSGLSVVLVPTVVPGVNDHDLGNLVHLAARRVPVVRGVHFQPISYFGRYPFAPDDQQRITLPEIMQLLEEQTGGQILVDHLRAPGCEHERCSFHGNFLVRDDQSLQPLGAITGAIPGAIAETTSDATCSCRDVDTSDAKGCCPPSAADGARAAINVVARQWSAPQPGQDNGETKSGSLDAFLAQTRTRTLAVTAMAFQDAWTLDLERLKGCCIHVAAPDGRLVPFCAWNLTSRQGRSPHRQGAWPCS